MSPKQDDLKIKTDPEDCIFLIVSQANYTLKLCLPGKERKGSWGLSPCAALCLGI